MIINTVVKNNNILNTKNNNMKTYNKTHCPDVIQYNGNGYKMDIDATYDYRAGVTLPSRYHIRVNVMSKYLKGKTDLHGNPYTQSIFIYTNELGFLNATLPTKLVETRPKYVKELNRIRKYGYGV